MKYKVFTNIIFEKKKYLILYIELVLCFVAYICIQSILLEHQYEESIHPDVELSGDLHTPGVFDYTMYCPLGQLTDQVKDSLGSDIKVQGVVIRNLLTIGRGIYNAEYRVWGMNDCDIDGLKGYVRDGRLPQKENEVLLGSYAARYYHLKIGDTVPFSLSLDENDTENGGKNYVVVGILRDNLKYFKGSFIVSKESFAKTHQCPEDNFIMIYVKNDAQYKKVESALSDIETKSNVSFNTSVSYTYKGSSNNMFSTNKFTLIAISIIVMILMSVYVLRGITKKIGLLKALGLSDAYLLKTFGTGLGCITVGSVIVSCILGKLFSCYLNCRASSFYGFKVEEYHLTTNTLLFLIVFNLINMFVSLITVAIIEKKVSPQAAMLKG